MRWEFLGQFGLRHQEPDGTYLVHGSPRDPTNEYILREDIHSGAYDKFDEIFAAFERRLLVGHSHTPCAMNEDLEYTVPADVGGRVTQTRGKKLIINVGSVGQPRDRDPRACYVVVDGDTIEWVRLEYDLETTIRKITANESLNAGMAQRLREGV